MKAQSISLNTIIVAVLALLVLIVIAVIFSGKMKIFGGESKRCANQGGTCVSDACQPNEAEVVNTDCVTPMRCCIRTDTSQRQ